jgi:hypothetical protein
LERVEILESVILLWVSEDNLALFPVATEYHTIPHTVEHNEQSPNNQDNYTQSPRNSLLWGTLFSLVLKCIVLPTNLTACRPFANPTPRNTLLTAVQHLIVIPTLVASQALNWLFPQASIKPWTLIHVYSWLAALTLVRTGFTTIVYPKVTLETGILSTLASHGASEAMVNTRVASILSLL